MRSRLQWVVAVLGLVAVACARAHDRIASAHRPHVYLVIVDGLGADLVDPALMPHLTGSDLEPVAFRGEGRAVMPTRTNPNHATLLTGVLPETHGITGNAYWSRKTRTVKPLDDPDMFDVATLFTVAESARPELVTLAAFSKAKLGHMFSAVEGRQRRPDVLWVPAEGVVGHLVGVADDGETMAAFLAASAAQEPDLAVVNLSEVDRAAHGGGKDATADARRHADAAIGRLVADLRARGRWKRSVLIVTADHGFDDVSPTAERPDPVVILSAAFEHAGLRGLHVVGDGGAAHVYVDGVSPDATSAGNARRILVRAAAVAWRTTGVAEVVARLAVPGVPLLGRVHPEWGLAHERAGDLLVTAAPGYHFVDPPDPITERFRGNHGSPREQPIALVIAGGALDGRFDPATPPTAADIGATIGALLGLPTTRTIAGAPVHAGAGHPLALPLRAP
jgi:arylsulfatase A-like enzyme